MNIPSINQVRSGVLVTHRYTQELGIIIRARWDEVEVLLTSGATVRWRMDGFRSTYEVIG